MNNLIPKNWTSFFEEETKKEYIKDLNIFIKNAYETTVVFPGKNNIFNAFRYFKPQDTKVIILGQDPYHGENQANGLAFSVPVNQHKIPPSLKNIFKELSTDIQPLVQTHGDLTSWAKQGVLLLNTTLTVEKGKAGSHQKQGWEMLTDFIIEKLSTEYTNLVFILWGKPAQGKIKIINHNKHLILQAPHPSPLSAYRGFFNSKPFSKANTYLKKSDKKEIQWQ